MRFQRLVRGWCPLQARSDSGEYCSSGGTQLCYARVRRRQYRQSIAFTETERNSNSAVCGNSNSTFSRYQDHPYSRRSFSALLIHILGVISYCLIQEPRNLKSLLNRSIVYWTKRFNTVDGKALCPIFRRRFELPSKENKAMSTPAHVVDLSDDPM